MGKRWELKRRAEVAGRSVEANRKGRMLPSKPSREVDADKNKRARRRQRKRKGSKART